VVGYLGSVRGGTGPSIFGESLALQVPVEAWRGADGLRRDEGEGVRDTFIIIVVLIIVVLFERRLIVAFDI
jgi:hypothetical protein